MKNLYRDHIFTNFVYSAELSVPAAEVHDGCVQLKQNYADVGNSNRNGWQSPGFGEGAPLPIFGVLADKVIEFANTVSASEQLGVQFRVANWWANINDAGAYNVVHSHPGTDLVVIYYPKVSAQSGNLALIRNDSALSSSLFNNKRQELSFYLRPETGRAYAFPAWFLHYVEPSQDSELRISVAYNLCVKSPEA